MIHSRERADKALRKRQMTDPRRLLLLARQAAETEGKMKLEAEQRYDEFLKTLQRRIGRKQVNKILNPSFEVTDFWLSEELCAKLKKRWGAYQEFEHKKSKKPLIGILREVIKRFSEPTVLEVGCGGGHFLWVVRSYAKRLIGVDSSPCMLNMTSESFAKEGIHNVGLRHGTCWNLPFASNSIDVVFQIDVCMHVGGSWNSIKEMLRVARKAIFFTGPSFEMEQRRLDEKKNLFGMSWGVSQPLLEHNLLQLYRRKPGRILNCRFLDRPSTKTYKHKILVVEKEYPGRKMKPSEKSLLHDFMPESIGVLCRGKSLERLSDVAKKFDHCFIVNSWRKEWKTFRRELRRKTIVHFVNHEKTSVMPPEVYKRLGIERAVCYWTKRHTHPGFRVKDASVTVELCEKAGVKLDMMPDEFLPDCNRIKNSGVMCCLYVSEVFRPKTLWVIGLDFYTANYWVGNLTKYQEKMRQEGLSDRLVDEFVGVVERYPEIEYKLITRCESLPKLDNLEIISKQ